MMRNLVSVVTVAAYFTIAGSIPAFACKPGGDRLYDYLEKWKLGCKHSLCATVYATMPSMRAKAHSCSDTIPAFALKRDLLEAQVGLLGEDHDNAAHHQLRSLLVHRNLNATRQWPFLVFEQLRSDQQHALDKFAELKTNAPDQATLPEFKRLTDWEHSGWATYNYDPLFQAAIDAKLPIYAGDVTRDAIMKVAKDGETALPADERARLKLDIPLGAKLDDASLSEIEEAHCHTMPKEALTGMAYAQRYRDASLADAVLKAVDKHGSAILIAGNGHVRTDRGVPWYVHQRAPDKKVVSVMLIEVEDGKNDPEAYVPRDPDGKPAADYIIFTPRAERGDPCEKMRAKMGK
jgi:uncharacterized iron-regulated protein